MHIPIYYIILKLRSRSIGKNIQLDHNSFAARVCVCRWKKWMKPPPFKDTKIKRKRTENKRLLYTHNVIMRNAVRVCMTEVYEGKDVRSFSRHLITSRLVSGSIKELSVRACKISTTGTRTHIAECGSHSQPIKQWSVTVAFCCGWCQFFSWQQW